MIYIVRVTSLMHVKHSVPARMSTASPKEFTDWLYQQSEIIITLCEL